MGWSGLRLLGKRTGPFGAFGASIQQLVGRRPTQQLESVKQDPQVCIDHQSSKSSGSAERYHKVKHFFWFWFIYCVHSSRLRRACILVTNWAPVLIKGLSGLRSELFKLLPQFRHCLETYIPSICLSRSCLRSRIRRGDSCSIRSRVPASHSHS